MQQGHIASFVPHEPKEIKGQLVFPMYPPVAQGDNSHFIQRQVTDLTSIVQDTSLTQKIDVEMENFWRITSSSTLLSKHARLTVILIIRRWSLAISKLMKNVNMTF